MLPAVRTGDDFLSPTMFILIAMARKRLRDTKRRDRDAYVAEVRADLTFMAAVGAVTPLHGPRPDTGALAAAVEMWDRLTPLLLANP